MGRLTGRAPGGPARRFPVSAHVVMALAAAALVTALQVLRLEPVLPLADAHGYGSIAWDLYRHGTFTDGSDVTPWPQPNPPPGMFVAPLYPAFAAAVLAIDPDSADRLACMLVHRRQAVAAGCDVSFGVLVVAQTALATVSAFLVFVAAYVVCGSLVLAWLAMLLALATGEYAGFAVQVLTENLVLPLFSAFSVVVVLAWRRPTALRWLAAGLLIGAAALVRPSFAYLFYATVLFASAGLLITDRGRLSRAGLMVSMLVLGYGFVVAPWLVRNALLLGVADITAGYGGHELAQRLAYNAMTWGQWLVAFVYWLPDFGDSLAAALFDPALYQRLSFDHPDSYYRAGQELYRESLAAAGGPEAHVGYLVRTYIMAEPVKHVMVTFALLWRGLWVGKVWGLIAFVCFVPMAVVAVRRRWSEAIVFALPPWFMAGFHAFVSVNIVRYNLILIPCFAIAMAWTMLRLAEVFRTRTRTLS